MKVLHHYEGVIGTILNPTDENITKFLKNYRINSNNLQVIVKNNIYLIPQKTLIGDWLTKETKRELDLPIKIIRVI